MLRIQKTFRLVFLWIKLVTSLYRTNFTTRYFSIVIQSLTLCCDVCQKVVGFVELLITCVVIYVQIVPQRKSVPSGM